MTTKVPQAYALQFTHSLWGSSSLQGSDWGAYFPINLYWGHNNGSMQKKEVIVLDNTCTKYDELIAAKDTIAILSGKWKIQLITTLNCGGALQFMEILRTIDGIGPKMLSKELQDLEANLIVKRTAMETRPVTVKYELTAHGHTLERIINEMRLWGRSHRREVIGK